MAPRHTVAGMILSLLLATGVSAPALSQGVLDTAVGPVQGDALGAVVARVGDVDGDGRPDLAVTATTLAEDQLLPRVDVFSSAGLGLLATLEGDADLDGFGTGLAGAGDVNADGIPDILVGAPDILGSGYARVYSGSGGAELLSLVGSNLYDRFGTAVAGLGDVNGDGVSDLAVGAPGVDGLATDVGCVRAFSGADGAVIWTVTGTLAAEQLGGVLAALGDLDGDGVCEVGIASFQTFANVSDVVHVHSGADGSFLFDLLGSHPGERFGSAFAAGGDIDRDGTPDVVVGAPDNDTSGIRAGAAYAVSGADGSVIHDVHGPASSAALGTAVGGGVDLDADGWFDLAVGVPWSPIQAGEVWMISGRDGTLLGKRVGDAEDSGLGTSIVGLGDVDGDGFDEILAGDPAILDNRGLAKLLTLPTVAPPLGVFAGNDGDSLGGRLAGGSDLDGDVVFDLLATRAVDLGVVAISGADQSLIWEDGEGRSDVALIADLDLDGVDDALTLTQQAVRVLSGVDGGEITTLAFPPNLTGVDAVASAGDVDGDGVADVIASSPTAALGGAAVVWSGATGVVLHGLQGDQVNQESFGSSVAGAGDLDGDMHDDLLVGARGTDTSEPGAGRVWVLSGASGLPLFTVDGEDHHGHLGEAVAGFVDITGDGVPEFLAGASGQSNSDPAKLICLSGVDGSEVWSLGWDTWGFASEIAVGGDSNGDGVPEVLTGHPGDDTGGLDVGAGFVVSGIDGTVLRRILGPNGPGEGSPQLGHPGALGDIDGDGFADVAFGAVNAQLGGENRGGVFFHSGRIPSWTGLGDPVAGTWGTPNLFAEGDLLPGAPFTLHLGGFVEAQPVTLIVGLSEAGVPFKGGSLVPAPDVFVSLLTDADGGAILPAIWSGGMPPGFTLWLQAWTVDAAGPKGFSASNGLKGVVP